MRPTLDAYMTERYGDRSTGNYVWPTLGYQTPEDRRCKKLEFDENAFRCQLGKYQKKIVEASDFAKRSRHSLNRISRADPRTFGSGEDGNQRKEKAMLGLSGNVSMAMEKHQMARPEFERAMLSYQQTRAQRESEGCRELSEWKPATASVPLVLLDQEGQSIQTTILDIIKEILR